MEGRLRALRFINAVGKRIEHSEDEQHENEREEFELEVRFLGRVGRGCHEGGGVEG